MPKAVYNIPIPFNEPVLVAESDEIETVEGNAYFPKDSVKTEYLKKSDTPYTCPWKGECRYYHVVVGDDTAENAAFEYPDPKPAAKQIKDHVAFWRGVEITD